MGRISKQIKVDLVPTEAYLKFVNELNEWWPNEYTWSQKSLHELTVDPRIDGLCSEIGPYGFRCDWGRVVDFEEGTFLELKWQIGPNREPVPNPDKASDILIEFSEDEPGTLIVLQHFNFGNYGEAGEAYKNAMDLPQGWNYILQCFRNYCADIENPDEDPDKDEE